jgi:diguanylate cyclase (GGDEF)-like protein/PAS domain S-box-containing protein
MIVLVILYLTCSSVYIFMGMLTLFKDLKSKINRIFFTICMNLSFWAFINALMVASVDARSATFYRRLMTLSWASFYSEVLYCIIYLTRKESYLKKPWHHIMLFFPAVFSIYLYFFQPATANDIVRIPYGWAFLEPQNRGILWNYFFNVYYISYTVAGVFMILNWGKKSKFTREQKQSKIIACSFIITAIIGTITDIILPQFGITLVPPVAIIFFIIAVGGIGYSIIKYRLMSLNTESVVLDVLKIMNEGLIISNHERSIISVNRGALQLLGYEETEIIGGSVDLVFSSKQDISELDRYNSCEIDMISKYNTKIPVLITSLGLQDKFKDKLGTVFIFQDISKIKQIQNKLTNAYDNLEKRVHERTYELNKVNLQLENEMRARIAKEEEIKKIAFSDYLTGLPNRRSFNNQLNEAILQAAQNKESLAIMFIDVDGFKMINDTMGHAQGDELLKKIAERLTNTLRKSDIFARVGGDEFLILLHSPTSKQYIEKICEDIINTVKDPFEVSKNDIYITTSIGVSIYPEDGEDVNTLVKNADIAMYKAKEYGKGRFAICNELMKNEVEEAMKLTNDLYRALELNELEVYYQPQVSTTTGRIVGLEDLLRWNHSKLGLIGPNDFIPIAEKTGLIVSIGEWVLRTACIQIKAWQDAGLPKISIAVNLSVNQIQSNKIVKLVSKILIETGLDPQNLELEITENILMKDINNIVNTLEELKNLNVRIALDDFGTEYSSLSYLKELPLDRIKIPKPFINGIDKNNRDEPIISAIIMLGKKFGLDLIAEGVETEVQFKFLKTHMCDEVQGFYFYKPMSTNEIEKLLKSIYTISNISTSCIQNTGRA